MKYKLTEEEMEKYDGFDCRPASSPDNPIKIPKYLLELLEKIKVKRK